MTRRTTFEDLALQLDRRRCRRLARHAELQRQLLDRLGGVHHALTRFHIGRVQQQHITVDLEGVRARGCGQIAAFEQSRCRSQYRLDELFAGRWTDEGCQLGAFGTFGIDGAGISMMAYQNIGAGSGMGFSSPDDASGSYKNMKSTIEDALKRVFNPEFLNRIDDIIVFHPLDKHHIFNIIDITAGKLFKRLREMGIEVEIDERAKEFLVDKGYDQKYGARPLKRALQKYVEDPLAEEMLKGRFTEGSLIRITFDEVEKELRFTEGHEQKPTGKAEEVTPPEEK
jgi:hypothetical protein